MEKEGQTEIIQAEGPAGRRARIKGTGADVWEVIATLKDNKGDIQATAEYLSLSEAQIEEADAYYQQNRGEIEERIEENRRASEELNPRP